MQDHGLEMGMDVHLIPRCAPALPFGNAKPVPVYIEERAINTQRAIGTTLSHEVPHQPSHGVKFLFWSKIYGSLVQYCTLQLRPFRASREAAHVHLIVRHRADKHDISSRHR